MQNMDITPLQSTTFIRPIQPLNLEELGKVPRQRWREKRAYLLSKASLRKQ